MCRDARQGFFAGHLRGCIDDELHPDRLSSSSESFVNNCHLMWPPFRPSRALLRKVAVNKVAATLACFVAIDVNRCVYCV
jgi:hypothetical protein